MVQENEGVNSIEQYLSEAKKLLSRRLPAQMVEQRVAEARTHLTERTEELMADGMGQSQAEATAVSAFGPAREWARSVLKAAYIDAGALRARTMATVSAIAAILCSAGTLAAYAFGEGSTLLHLMEIFLLSLTCLAMLAFRSRASRTPLLLVVAAITIAGVAIYSGCSFYRSGEIVWSKTFVNRELRSTSLVLGYYRRESQMLTIGLATYAGSKGQTAQLTVPPSLRTPDGRFIVPRALIMRRNATLFPNPDDPIITAFKEFTDTQRAEFPVKDHGSRLGAAIQVMDRAPYRTVATEAEAAREWRRFGPAWLTSLNVSIRNDSGAQAQWKKVAASSGFLWFAAWPEAWDFFILLAMVLFVDFVAAAMGRWAFRFIRRNRGMAGG